MKKKKLFTAILLTFVLTIVGALPATAFADNTNEIASVAITINKPVVGQALDTTVDLSTDNTDGIASFGVTWKMVDAANYSGDIATTVWQAADTTAEADKCYLLSVKVDADYDGNGYYFYRGRVLAGVNTDVDNTKVDYGADKGANHTDTITVNYIFYTSSSHTHSYNPDKWTTTATYHWHQCTDANCPDKADSIKDKAKHTFKWVVDREATVNQTGLKHKVCTECGYTCDENTKIAKLTSDSDSTGSNSTKSNSTGSDSTAASDSSPQTGDTMNIAIPLGAMLVSAAGIGVAMYLRKRQYS